MVLPVMALAHKDQGPLVGCANGCERDFWGGDLTLRGAGCYIIVQKARIARRCLINVLQQGGGRTRVAQMIPGVGFDIQVHILGDVVGSLAAAHRGWG